jgi:hypothetical protein
MEPPDEPSGNRCDRGLAASGVADQPAAPAGGLRGRDRGDRDRGDPDDQAGLTPTWKLLGNPEPGGRGRGENSSARHARLRFC